MPRWYFQNWLKIDSIFRYASFGLEQDQNNVVWTHPSGLCWPALHFLLVLNPHQIHHPPSETQVACAPHPLQPPEAKSADNDGRNRGQPESDISLTWTCCKGSTLKMHMASVSWWMWFSSSSLSSDSPSSISTLYLSSFLLYLSFLGSLLEDL